MSNLHGIRSQLRDEVRDLGAATNRLRLPHNFAMVYPLAGLRTCYAADDLPQFDSALGWTQNLSAAWSLSVLTEHGDLRPGLLRLPGERRRRRRHQPFRVSASASHPRRNVSDGTLDR